VAKAIYLRMRAQYNPETKDYSVNSKGKWVYAPVCGSDDRGRRPVWQIEAEKRAKAKIGRGFQYRLPGRGWSEQFDTVAEAEAAADGQRNKGASVSASPDDADRTPIRAAIDNFLARKEGKRNASSVEAYTYILNEFLNQLPRHIRFIDQVNGDVLESFFRFLQKAGAAPKTIQNKILVVCFMLKSAGVREPSKMIELPKLEDEPVEPYSSEALKTLFAEMTPEETARYRFFLDTACREAEVAHAQWGDIDWKSSEYIVRTKTWKTTNGLTKSFTTKNHKSRRVPLTRNFSS